MIHDVSRAVVFPAPNAPPETRNYPLPYVEPGGVLLSVIASEICGTDVHLHHGRLSGVPYPLIPGHVSVGEIVDLRGAVNDVDGEPFHVGEVVTFLDVFGSCGRCRYCSVYKATTRCPHRRVYGITVGADEPPGLAGGWSEYLYLRPGTQLLRLPASVSPDAFIGAGCGLPTAVHAIELARIGIGDRVLIQGSGPVGLSLCALALASGAGWVGVIGAPEPRLAVSRRFGADCTIDVTLTTSDERRCAILDATNGIGADVTIEASGNPNAVPEGCELTRDGGRYVIVGQYTDNGDVLLNPHRHINRNHLEIRGCWGSDFSHVYRAVGALERFGGRFDWSSLISLRFGLDDVAEGLHAVERGEVVKAIIDPRLGRPG